MMPQDKDGNVAREYSTIPVLMCIGGLGLGMFGFLYAKVTCENQLIKNHKQTDIHSKEEKKNG